MYRVCVCVQFSSSYLFIDLTLWLYLYSCVVPTRFLRFTRADKRREAGSGREPWERRRQGRGGYRATVPRVFPAFYYATN